MGEHHREDRVGRSWTARSWTARSRSRRSRGRSRLPTPIEALLPWGPVLVGIGILIGLMISAFVVPAGDVTSGGPEAAVPPALPDPTTQAPPDRPDPQPPRFLVPEAYEVQYSPTPPEPPPPPPPPVAELAGTYRLEEIDDGVFIAAVEIVNESSVAGGWTVELDYGRDVGRLNGFWVDGTPQPSLDVDDDRFIFTSAVDVEPRTSVMLRMHFDRFGFDIAPRACLVDGGDCTIVDPWDDHDR